MGAQLIKNQGDLSQTNYIDLGASMVGGYLGYGGGLRWNALVGTSVGMVQTEANNLYYGKNNSLLIGGLTNGATTMIGFRVGDGYSNWMSTSPFTTLGPVITGNAMGPMVTEGLNTLVEKWSDDSDKANQKK